MPVDINTVKYCLMLSAVCMYLVIVRNLQDRLMLAMEQELVRAHQRATKQCSPISVCAVLLERLLPRTEWSSEERLGGVLEHSGEDKRCGFVFR